MPVATANVPEPATVGAVSFDGVNVRGLPPVAGGAGNAGPDRSRKITKANKANRLVRTAFARRLPMELRIRSIDRLGLSVFTRFPWFVDQPGVALTTPPSVDDCIVRGVTDARAARQMI
jgi:hypothetical protein